MNDPYVYPDTNVLVNRLDIKDNQTLDRYENVVTNLSLLKIIDMNPKISSIADIKNVHKIIFFDVYEWAGQYRTINMIKNEEVINGKSVDYADYHLIDIQIEELNISIKGFNWDISKPMLFTQQLAKFVAKLWQIHPFREGNTRATVTFFVLWLRQKNIFINEQVLKENAAYFRNSLVMASLGLYSENHYLEGILYDALFTDHTHKMTEENHKKYKSINDYDVSKYKYNYHHSK